MTSAASRAGTGRVRLALAVAAAVASLVFGLVMRPAAPTLPATASGDADLIRTVRAGGEPGHRMAVVVLDGPTERVAYFGADPQTRFEIGSLTKAMNGFVIADAVERDELSLDDKAGEYLELGSGEVSQVTMGGLVTHHSGLPRVAGGLSNGARTFWALVTATSPYSGDLQDVERAAREARLADPSFRYSNLGAAVAGQATLAAVNAGSPSPLTYPQLMRERLFAPVGMTDTSVQTDQALVDAGRDAAGRSQQPWVMDGYAPAGAVVSTAGDLTRLARAVLSGQAPGLDALEPLADTDDGRIGMFWLHGAYPGEQQTFQWHNGGTGGYSSYLAVDRQRQHAVIVLSDVAVGATPLGLSLITSENLWNEPEPGSEGDS